MMKETLVEAYTDIRTSEPTGTFSRTQMSHPSSPKARLSDSGLGARFTVSGSGDGIQNL